jgi:hypothetical protein
VDLYRTIVHRNKGTNYATRNYSHVFGRVASLFICRSCPLTFLTPSDPYYALNITIIMLFLLLCIFIIIVKYFYCYVFYYYVICSLVSLSILIVMYVPFCVLSHCVVLCTVCVQMCTVLLPPGYRSTFRLP